MQSSQKSLAVNTKRVHFCVHEHKVLKKNVYYMLKNTEGAYKNVVAVWMLPLNLNGKSARQWASMESKQCTH